MEVAQGAPQSQSLGDGGILAVCSLRRSHTRRFCGCRQGGGLDHASLAIAAKSQQVMLQQGIVVLQLALLRQDPPQAQVKLVLKDGWQLLKQLMKAASFGFGSLQIPLQTAQGG
jgi:hypothetical protein